MSDDGPPGNIVNMDGSPKQLMEDAQEPDKTGGGEPPRDNLWQILLQTVRKVAGLESKMDRVEDDITSIKQELQYIRDKVSTIPILTLLTVGIFLAIVAGFIGLLFKLNGG